MPEKKNSTYIGNTDGSASIWIGTLFVALAIIGLCVYVAVNNKKQEPAPVAQTAPPVDVTEPVFAEEEPAPSWDEPAPEPERLAVQPREERDIVNPYIPVIEPEPEPVVEAGPPTLQLDNLAGTMELSVPFLKMRNKMPLENTCFRDNKSPELSWTGAPAGTQSFVVFMEKRDPALDEPFTQWLLFNIPADTNRLGAGQAKDPQIQSGARHANSDHDNVGYIGPCDSKGQFKYALRVFALDTMLDLPPRAHKYDLIRAMNGHILDAAERGFVHYYKL